MDPLTVMCVMCTMAKCIDVSLNGDSNMEHDDDDDEEFVPPFLAEALCHIIERGSQATERPFEQQEDG